MKNALWLAVSLLCGWWAVARAEKDIRQQRLMGHMFGEAHLSDNAVTAWMMPVLCACIVFLFSLRHESAWLVSAFTACVTTGLRVSLVDIDTHSIPQRIMLRASILLLLLLGAAALANSGVDLTEVLMAGTISWSAMRLLEMLSRGDLGHADVVLSGYLGLFIGAVESERLVTALFVSFLIAGLVALVMIAIKSATRTSHIPFGPFLFVGMVVAVLR
jgi:leader peptidase (prepilin peptidase)/N-methyltransferase